MPVRSLRAYLIVVLLSVICLSNFLAALQGYRNSLRAADQLVDQQVSEKAGTLATLITHQEAIPANIFDNNTFFQVWQGESLKARSANAPSQRLLTAHSGFHFTSYAGIRWRTQVFPLPDDSRQVIVAQRFDVYSRLTEAILLKAILPIIWVLPIVGLLIWLIVTIGLNPLKRLAEILNRRPADEFSGLDPAQYPQELTVVVDSLNNLFMRLSEAFERERRFSADAAHELRTPVAALKVDIHNLSLASPEDPHLERLKKSVDRVGHSLEQMLALHRVTSDQSGINREYLELGAIAKNVIGQIYPQLDARQQQIELIDEATSGVFGEQLSLEMMLRNLLDNASKYTPEGGRIQLTISDNEDMVRLVVEDSGPGIPEPEYDRVLDRFYRVGGDRHQSGVIGSGLGLSIVRYAVNQHGGRIRFGRSPSLNGLSVTIDLAKSGNGSD